MDRICHSLLPVPYKNDIPARKTAAETYLLKQFNYGQNGITVYITVTNINPIHSFIVIDMAACSKPDSFLYIIRFLEHFYNGFKTVSSAVRGSAVLQIFIIHKTDFTTKLITLLSQSQYLNSRNREQRASACCHKKIA